MRQYSLPVVSIALLAGCLTDFDEALLKHDTLVRDTAVTDAVTDAAADAAADTSPDAAPGDGSLPETAPDAAPDGPAADQGPLVLANNGAACSTDADCYSGHCAEGLCCNLPCTAACVACNLSGSKGICTAVARGSKPVSGKSCPSSSKGKCDGDGKCDGLGSCRNWPDGTVCKAASCTAAADKEIPAKLCDGAGTCRSVTTVTELTCAPYACDASNGGCLAGCSSDSECTAPSACTSTKCTGGKPGLGTPCTSGPQCASGICVEGVCCESLCTDTCKTCSLPGVEGLCVNVPAGVLPPTGKSCPSNPPCGEDGRCDGNNGCRITPTGTPCAGTVCFDGPADSVLRQSSCDASTKKCVTSESSCGKYVCQPGVPSCYGRCDADSQCQTGASCVGGYCN